MKEDVLIVTMDGLYGKALVEEDLKLIPLTKVYLPKKYIFKLAWGLCWARLKYIIIGWPKTTYESPSA